MCVMVFALTIARAEDTAHDDLRKMRTEVVDAITKGDIEKVLTYLHPNVVVTWQNGEVCRGHDGVRAFFDRMGKQSFRGYKVPPTPDDLTIMHDANTGVSHGRSVGAFHVLGKSFEFENRWTATLVKVDGRWMLASYHVSWNALDNPLLTAAKRAVYVAAPLAFLAGMILGGFIIKRKYQCKRKNAKS